MLLELQCIQRAKPPFNYVWQPGLLAEPYRSIAQGLAFLVPIWESGGDAVDVVSGRAWVKQTNATWTQGIAGIGSTTTSTTLPHFLGPAGYEPFTTSDGAGTGDFSLLATSDVASEARLAVLIMLRDATLSKQTGLLANYDDPSVTAGSMSFYTYDGSLSEAATASVVDGAVHTFVGCRSGTTHTLDRDGLQVATATATARNIYNAGLSQLGVGGEVLLALDRSVKERMYLGAGWNRALSAGERFIVGNNPWGLLIPEEWWAGTPTPAAAAFVSTLLMMGCG